jgi:hypothetical protein
MPDLSPEQKYVNLTATIKAFEKIVAEPPHKRSGLPAYCERRLPVLRARLNQLTPPS